MVETDAGAHPRGQFQYLEHLPALAAVVDDTALVEALSERELEILRLIARGLSNQDIMQRLVIAKSTLKTHINHIYSKLAVRNRVQAIVQARSLRLLDETFAS